MGDVNVFFNEVFFSLLILFAGGLLHHNPTPTWFQEKGLTVTQMILINKKPFVYHKE